MADSAKVLVTGASGYIASHVVQQLQEAGHVVRGTVRSVKNLDKVKHLYDLCPNAAHKLELVEADLLDADCWPKAVKGMTFVIHVASPLPVKQPRNEDDLIKPAMEGTLSVLRACATSGTVKRVVLTSSAMAVGFDPASSERTKTEEDWEEERNVHGYAKSKLLAERAAWDFIQQLSDEEKFELSVVIPCAVLGPPIHNTLSASVEIVLRVLDRQIPAIPKFNVPVIDVRDVAAAHVRAMTLPEASGNRFLCCAGNLWLMEIAEMLKSEFGPQGYSIPTLPCPNFLLRVVSLFDSSVRHLTPNLGVTHRYDNTKMREVLKIEPRDVRDTIIDMAYALIDKGFVKKTSKYRGPANKPEDGQPS